MARAEEEFQSNLAEIEAKVEAQEAAEETGQEDEVTEEALEAPESDAEEQPADEPADGPESDTGESEAPEKISWREAMGKIDWEGYSEAKLEEMDPHLASQRQYYSRAINEALEKKREYDELIANAGSRPAPEQVKEEAGAEPPMPTLEDNVEEFNRKLSAVVDYRAQMVAERESKAVSGKVGEVEKKLQSMEEARAKEREEVRVREILAMPDVTPEVGRQMDVILKEYPQLGEMMWSDDGAKQVIKMAKDAVDMRAASARSTERKATAGDRAITKPTPAGAAKNTVKTITGKTPEELARAIADSDEYTGLFEGQEDY